MSGFRIVTVLLKYLAVSEVVARLLSSKGLVLSKKEKKRRSAMVGCYLSVDAIKKKS